MNPLLWTACAPKPDGNSETDLSRRVHALSLSIASGIQPAASSGVTAGVGARVAGTGVRKRKVSLFEITEGLKPRPGRLVEFGGVFTDREIGVEVR